jgi:hypothetical protein
MAELLKASTMQGWVHEQDAIKDGRGQTVSNLASSYMAKASNTSVPVASLLDLSLHWANEQRLEELYHLYLRQTHVMPGPGDHEVSFPTVSLHPE